MLCVLRSLLLLALIFSSALGFAKIELPSSLSASDRATVLRILGAGTTAKILADPYPLGGFPGIEVGYTLETVSVSDLEGLGSGAESFDEFNFSKITLGKGLYNDIDIFIEFMPYGATSDFSSIGALLRWNALRTETVPFSLVALIHGNSSNFSNKLSTQSFAYELLGTLHIDRLALYGGLGYLQVGGRFLGGDTGLTDSGRSERGFVTMEHNFFGMSYRFTRLFISAQVDRYHRSVVSGKIGLRF